MHKMDQIKEILMLQKRELEFLFSSSYIKRDSELAELEKNIIKVVTGPRRSGKSFFIANELKNLGRFGYANFDDEKLIKTKNYNEIIESLKTIYNNPQILFFDEIQNLLDWELFVNRLLRQGYNIIITGSNSKLLSRDLATHLTGRQLSTIIFPLSFKEYLSYYGSELTPTEIKEKLSIYSETGGFPEPLVKGMDYFRYLKELYDSVIFRDIIKRYNIRSVKSFEGLSEHLISNSARKISYSSLAKTTSIKSPHTIEKYIKYLEEAFLFFELKAFSFKIKEQIKSGKKIYAIDNGLINSKSFAFSKNLGRMYENLVAIELRKRELKGDIKLFYYKNNQQEEVDFVIMKDMKINQLIQVCYDPSNKDTIDREVRALIKSGKELKCASLIIITHDYEAQENKEWFGIKGKIRYVPLWKWLLS